MTVYTSYFGMSRRFPKEKFIKTAVFNFSMAIIYRAHNKVTNKNYIGQTRNSLRRRQSGHYTAAFKNNSDFYFHRALRKYGKEAFDWFILEEVSLEELNSREQFWVSEYKSNQQEFGYNLTTGGFQNMKVSETTRRKLSVHSSNNWKNAEYRERGLKYLAQNLETMWKDPEYRKKKISSQIGNQYSLGHKHSEETKELLRAKNLGRNNPMYGRTTSKKQKAKASEIGKSRTADQTGSNNPMYGKSHSEESRSKISASLRDYYRKKREGLL